MLKPALAGCWSDGCNGVCCIGGCGKEDVG